MPVISTLGALTYNKILISTGSDWRYWNLLIQNSNISNSSQINDAIFNSTTEYIYGVGFLVGVNSLIILKINNTANYFTQPNIDWISRETQGNFANANINFDDEPLSIISINNDSNLIVTGTSQSQPKIQFNIDISTSTGNVNFAKGYAARPLGNGGTGSGIYRFPESITFDSSNNYYTIGQYNQQLTAGTANANVRLGISSFNGTTGLLINSKAFGLVPNVNVSVTGTYYNRVHMDNTDTNLIITGLVPGSNTYSIANISSNLTTINWQKSFSNSFSPEDSTVVDSNIYAVGPYVTFTYAITKIDSTGNVIWSKQTSNTSINSITVNNANTSQLIITGQTEIANSVTPIVSTIDSTTGNLVWQTSLTYTGANGFWSNAILNIFSVKSTNDQILLSGNISSQAGGHFTGCIVTLPTNGTVPGDGVTTLQPNLTLTISSGNFFSVSNSNITVTTSNYSLITPLTSQFANTTITSNANTLTTTSFINLA